MQEISDRAKQILSLVDGMFAMPVDDAPLLAAIQAALDAERSIDSLCMEAWGRCCLVYWNNCDRTTDSAFDGYQMLEIRLVKGERSPELLAEIETLTAQLTKEPTDD